VSSLKGPQALSRIGKTGGSALIEIVREGTAGQFIEASGAERVSVIIPAFNVAPYIAETLKAVFAQTKSAFEVIVVNDGSPDMAHLILRSSRRRSSPSVTLSSISSRRTVVFPELATRASALPRGSYRTP
jgi:cellulose synthase/poly-beta-1,6-N-acetylglucosamine synthase-like glycosyltransferase